MEVDVKRVQKRLLKMAVAIKKILECAQIKYMITFGTLLGAVRHKGFIPWDDDFDFFIFQEDYEKAKSVLRDKLPKDMFLEDENSEPLYFHSWAHVKDLNSIAEYNCYPQDSIYAHKGLSIDLYVAVKMEETEIDLWRLQQNLLYRQRLYASGVITSEQLDEYTISFEKKIAKEKQHIKNMPKKGKQYAMVFEERIMRCNEIFPLKVYQFENTYFCGPNMPEALLSRFYGTFMELPPHNKRIPHYTNVTFLKD